MRVFSMILAAALLSIACLGASGENTPPGSVVYSVDFSGAAGSPSDWLAKNNFQLKHDASSLRMSFSGGSLVMESPRPLLAVMMNDNLRLKQFSKIRIHWGVMQYPKDACYEKGVNNEQLMIYVFFGDKKLPSGSMFIPDSPYFLGLFLGQFDIPGKSYVGRHFTAGGRFVCVGAPKAGETVVTEYDLPSSFKDNFGLAEVPHISGLSLEVDTSYLRDGRGKAFVKKIEILR